MGYRQLTSEERYTIARLKWQGWGVPDIAEIIGRHRSTVWREIKRNAKNRDGVYRAEVAHSYAVARRRRSRRNQQFDYASWGKVVKLLREDYSPDQAAGYLRRFGLLSISHQKIYRYIKADYKRGGSLYDPSSVCQQAAQESLPKCRFTRQETG